ncbi:MAG: hypothetical protein UEX99_03965, partial [Acutalibacteraceae bacterium]|nr:hypothetical protein [Acutalibacteraceae bacterium]
LQQPQNQGKAEGLAACNSQTTSPLGSLNSFYPNSLSNFLGSHQFAAAGFVVLYCLTSGMDKSQLINITAHCFTDFKLSKNFCALIFL